MKQTTIPVKPDGRINIKAQEDLSIEGSDAKMLTAVVSHGDSMKILESTGGLEIKSSEDCRLLIPASTTVTVDKVGGDAFLKNLENRAIVGKIGGDLTMIDVAGASIEMAGGDFSIRGSKGAVEVARTGGDLLGIDVFSFSSGAIGGDATLKNVGGSVNITAGGDVLISCFLETLPEIKIKAGGDITLITSEHANGMLNLHNKGESISVSACGQSITQDTFIELPLGEGGNEIDLNAGGEILVTDKDNLVEGENGFATIEHQWSEFGSDLERRIREGLVMASQSADHASKVASMASEIAREKMDKAMRKLEKKGFSKGHRSGMVGFTYEQPAKGKEKTGPAVSDEERMLVLRMLQEKKISVEEAEKLLNALDR